METEDEGGLVALLNAPKGRRDNRGLSLRWLPYAVLKADGGFSVIGAKVEAQSFGHSASRQAGAGRGRRRSALGQWQREWDANVLRAACREAASWPEELRLQVALDDPRAPDEGFAARLRQIVKDTGFPVDRLDLCFAQEGVSRAGPVAWKTVAALRDCGARVFLRDFGLPPSSLSFLQQWGHGGLLDGVQFDASALLPILSSDREVVSFYRVALGVVGALGLSIQAGGIITPELLGFALQAGCSEASGSLIAPVETGAALLKRFRQKADSLDGASCSGSGES